MNSSRTGKKPYRLSPVWIELARLFTVGAFAVLFVALMFFLGGCEEEERATFRIRWPLMEGSTIVGGTWTIDLQRDQADSAYALVMDYVQPTWRAEAKAKKFLEDSKDDAAALERFLECADVSKEPK